MYYVSFGTGDKRLVVLPGLSDGLATVKGKALILSAPYRKFFSDYTVYMFSRKEIMPEGYSIKDMAADQAEAMKQLGINRAYVLGVSQGGMIAQSLTIDFPQLVEGLILAVTAPYANKTAEAAVCGWMEMAAKGDHTALMVDTAEKMYTRKYMEKNRKIFPLIARLTKPKSYERFFRNCEAILSFDAREELGKISCPTYVIAGDDDNTVGNEAPYEFERAIKNSTLHIYKGIGHSAFEECPDFYDRVLEFCDSCSL